PPPVKRTSPLWNQMVPLALMAVLISVLVVALLPPILERLRRPPPPPEETFEWLPQDFEVKERGNDPRLPQSLLFTGLGEGVAPPEFLLVPWQKDGDPPSFYVMRDKVTNQQFLAALKDEGMRKILRKWGKLCPKAVRQDWGELTGLKPGDARRPVGSLTALEAHCFAERLSGKLPSPDQWLKPAGPPHRAPRPFPAPSTPPTPPPPP